MKVAKLKPAIPQLPSGNIEITADFFETKLGFEILAKFPEQNHLIVSRGSAEIHFWQSDTEQHAHDIGSQSSCYIRVKKIEILYLEYKDKEVPFRHELVEQPWGMKEMQIDDPYGNAIRFGEQIG